MRGLDPADARRASAFAEKLVVAPEASSLHPEIVHEAHNRTVRSFRVTQDMRAIAHVEADRVLLLFVARHDAAYNWARNHCIECLMDGGDMRVRLTRVGADGRQELAPFADGKACCIETVAQLRALLGEYGIATAGA